ncbi:MAG TPA: DUF2461 domain-containing protein [Sulfurovum sp.]|nr:DUF2461 domain-containing protein [Sulfurovum sp.]
MEFKGFPKEGLTFLDEIVTNNTKEWFEANRHRHEQYIVGPNKAFVDEMSEHLQILVPSINAISKTNKSLFKIYRDSRFHPAEPIKTKIGIIFWQGAGHRMQSSSFYMHYEPHEILWAGGIRNFKPALLSAYRDYIKNPQRRKELHQILEKLKSKDYSIPEPHYKRYPTGFGDTMSHGYLSLYRAMFAFISSKPNRIFHSADIVDKSFRIYEDMFELQQWTYELTLHQKVYEKPSAF